MRGYTREDMGGWHLRVVQDRTVARRYLRGTWANALPSEFYRWLRYAPSGQTYVLRQTVHCPELWVIPPVEAAA